MVGMFGRLSCALRAYLHILNGKQQSHIAFQSGALLLNYTQHLCVSGVYKEPGCMWKADELDHAVTLMGYGTNEGGEDYWLIK